MRRYTTPFGKEVFEFRRDVGGGMPEREFVALAGVNYWTLREVCSGRTTGDQCELIPKCRRFMNDYIDGKEAVV